MQKSDECKDLFAALAKVQAEIRGALKDAANPFFKSKYADLESVWEACRVPLTKNGLSVIQTMSVDPAAGTCLDTTLAHLSGQWISGTLPISAIKADPQAQGSAITYARRYALAAIVGIVQVDDDAEGAMGRQGEHELKNVHTPKAVPQPAKPSDPLAPMEDACPKCNGKMMISKYPNQTTGTFDWYCSKCRVSKPRAA